MESGGGSVIGFPKSDSSREVLGCLDSIPSGRSSLRSSDSSYAEVFSLFFISRNFYLLLALTWIS
jgi:hypothetical protein